MTKRKERLRGNQFRYGRVRPGGVRCHHCQVLIFHSEDMPYVPINQHNSNSMFCIQTNWNADGYCLTCHYSIVLGIPEHTLEVSYE